LQTFICIAAQKPEKDMRNVDFSPPLEKFLRTPMVIFLTH